MNRHFHLPHTDSRLEDMKHDIVCGDIKSVICGHTYVDSVVRTVLLFSYMSLCVYNTIFRNGYVQRARFEIAQRRDLKVNSDSTVEVHKQGNKIYKYQNFGVSSSKEQV